MTIKTVHFAQHTGLPWTRSAHKSKGTEFAPQTFDPQDMVRFGEAKKTAPTLSKSEQRQCETLAKGYVNFLEKATCSPWTAKTIIEEAEKKGFKAFSPETIQNAKAGDTFYINNDYESVALVVLGKDDPLKSGFNIIGAHMDSPQLLLKEVPELDKGGLSKLRTRKHGGITLLTWFNRALGVSGRVFDLERDQSGKPKLDPVTGFPIQTSRFVKTKDSVGIIPIEAIHHNRDINKAREIKPEEDMLPLVGLERNADAKGTVTDPFSKAGIDLGKAGESELYLHSAEKPQFVGRDGSLIEGQGHDDRSMCYTAMQALFDASRGKTPQKTSIVFFFNNEEVGSEGPGGAQSRWVEHTIGNILKAKGQGEANVSSLREEALSKSVILSADVAHAFDPDKRQYHDVDNPMKMGFGPVLKVQDGSYASTARGINMVKAIAERNGVPVQTLSTNQNATCGTTIGPFIASNTGALTVDVGTPILSMHAIREIVSKPDLYFTKKLFKAFLGNT